MNPTRRYKPGDDIYQESLPEFEANGNPEQETWIDCDSCHRLFTLREIVEFCKPFMNRGQQEGRIKCPTCGYEMPVAFALDKVQ